MVRSFALGTMVAGLCLALVSPASADDRVSASKKGSLLMYSKVELRWTCAPGGPCVLTQDTFIDISNDFNDDVNVQFYFVNGDGPLDEETIGDPPIVIERAHPGWNWVDCEITLTANQPTFMSMATGRPAGCQPFTILDPFGIGGEGRPDPDTNALPGSRVLRGFVYAWAVGPDSASPSNEAIRWNHLSGDALIVNFLLGTAAEYNAYAFQVVDRVGGPAHGDPVGTPGVLNLDGVDYDLAFDKLLVDFYASGSDAFSHPQGGPTVIVDTDITLHAVSADLRQDTEGPITTKAKFDIWNENEVRFSGTEKCITCWDQTLASDYPAPNHLLVTSIQTDKGKARIDGLGSTQCPLSVDAALLGITIKILSFVGDGFATSAITMVGQGEESAVIRYDIIEDPDSATSVPGTIGGVNGLKNSGRIGR